MKPLSELTGYTKVLVEQDLNWGEYIRTKIKSICEAKHDEVGKLAEALMQMEKMLQTYIVNLTETTAAKETHRKRAVDCSEHSDGLPAANLSGLSRPYRV